MGHLGNHNTIAVDGMRFTISELSDATMLVSVRRTTRRISARWRDGLLRITVPPGMMMGQIIRFVNENADRIMQRRPVLRFHVGQTMEFDNFIVSIHSQSLAPGKILLQGETFRPRILVANDLDLDNDLITASVSRLLCIVARTVAPSLILPEARKISERIGITPASWSVSRGHTILGRCNRCREIALSEVVVFLPSELRRYIICHELAHLSEFNHSPRFHAICDRYLDGREKELSKKLKTFNWPIIRK